MGSQENEDLLGIRLDALFGLAVEPGSEDLSERLMGTWKLQSESPDGLVRVWSTPRGLFREVVNPETGGRMSLTRIPSGSESEGKKL